MRKMYIILFALTSFFAVFTACKKVEFEDEKRGGCYNIDSPDYDASVDYDDGNCQFAYLTGYEITYHSEKDGSQDWDLWANTDADLKLIVRREIDNVIIFTSSEKTNQAHDVPATWTAPMDLKVLNQNYNWELWDVDDTSGDDFIGSGSFNPIKQLVAGKSEVTSGHPNDTAPTTLFKLRFVIKDL